MGGKAHTLADTIKIQNGLLTLNLVDEKEHMYPAMQKYLVPCNCVLYVREYCGSKLQGSLRKRKGTLYPSLGEFFIFSFGPLLKKSLVTWQTFKYLIKLRSICLQYLCGPTHLSPGEQAKKSSYCVRRKPDKNNEVSVVKNGTTRKEKKEASNPQSICT